MTIRNFKKPTLVSFCTGIGGFDKGGKLAGFHSLYASDVWDVAKTVFDKNASGKNNLPDDHYQVSEGIFELADLSKVTSMDIHTSLQNRLGIALGVGELDCIISGSPCQYISPANYRRRPFALTNLLMIDQLRVTRELLPKVAVFEQVPGYLDKVMEPLKVEFECYYHAHLAEFFHMSFEVLNAKYYGARQDRRRVIIMLVRKDIGKPSFPQPSRVSEDAYLDKLFPYIGGYFTGKHGDILTPTKGRVFGTMTASGEFYVYDNELKTRRPFKLEEKLKLCFLEGYNLDGIDPEDQNTLLGNMVQIPFAEALLRHVRIHILKK